MSTNLGFARACNAGIAASSGRFVWLLNADVVISPECIAGMLAFADEHPRVGLANPMVLWPDGRPQPSLAKIPSFREALWKKCSWSTRLHRLTRQQYEKRSWVSGVDYRLPQSMEFLRGSCLLVRREVINTVGVLDPAFFFGHEELDYCRRVRDAGWRLMWIGERATVVHHDRSERQIRP